MKTIIVLALFLATACNQIPVADRVFEQHETQEDTTKNEVQSIGNMESIGTALGCVFAPQTCQKSK